MACLIAQALPEAQLGGIGVTSQARAISSCTVLVPGLMGENSLIFFLSFFLLYSFGHFSLFPASPSKINQTPY